MVQGLYPVGILSELCSKGGVLCCVLSVWQCFRGVFTLPCFTVASLYITSVYIILSNSVLRRVCRVDDREATANGQRTFISNVKRLLVIGTDRDPWL